MTRTLQLAFIFLFFLKSFTVQAQKITDTIFFNKAWQICEKPIAAYYRIGTIVADSVWYYTGPFKDYSVDGVLLVEGSYSENGHRDGLFTVYDTEGHLLAKGRYIKGKPVGDWEWKYINGTTRAIINFPETGTDFRFLYYKDNTGNVLLDNGTGNFIWSTAMFEDIQSYATIVGSFINGNEVVHGSTMMQMI